MRYIIGFFLAAFLLLGGCTENIGPEILTDGIDDISTSNITQTKQVGITIVTEDLDTPWEIELLPDQTMLISERSGNIVLVKEGKKQIAADIEVNEISEAGLLGLVIDPDFDSNRYIYIYYTYGDDLPLNRVSRYTFINGSIHDELILIDSIPSARYHNGGRLAFGPDGMLYITTGDATQPSTAQDTSSLAGKILRIDKGGAIPDDNPFENPIYSYGHRNPQGLAWDEQGRLYSSEHGPSRHDEINLIIKGGNYGWPDRCDQQGNDSIAPLRCYTDFTIAPGDIEYFKGRLYVTGLRGTQIREIKIENSSIVSEKIILDDLGRLRALESDGERLYASTSNKDGRGIPDINDDKVFYLTP